MICTKCWRDPRDVVAGPTRKSASENGNHVYEAMVWSRLQRRPYPEVCGPLRDRNALDDYQDWALEGYPYGN